MAQESITEYMSGQDALEVINSNFTELYGALFFPTRLPGISTNTTFVVPADGYVDSIDITASSGTPTISIGSTPNGTDIVASQQPGTFSHNIGPWYYPAATTWYITVSGGAINIRINMQTGYF